MAKIRKHLKFFLASPGDLQKERKSASSVVHEFNKIFGEQFGYEVELVGWEDTTSGFGRPQALINQDLEKCEFFIGMLWKRWGTVPDRVGKFSSGFEEEFEISRERRLADGFPEISLLFKNIDESLLEDPGDELKKVLSFKKGIIDGKDILFEAFNDETEFTQKLFRIISRAVLNLVNSDREDEQRDSDRPLSNDLVRVSSERHSYLASETSTFLHTFLSKLDRADESLDGEDVARFRLISSTLNQSGNDETYLGVHDANILYVNRKTRDLSPLEKSGLIDSGLEHIKWETVPFWYWLREANATQGSSLLTLRAFMGTSVIRSSAFKAMALTHEPIQLEFIDRAKFLSICLSKSTSSDVKESALEYLVQCGVLADLGAIEAEIELNNYQTRSVAIDALVSISSRSSRQEALDAILKYQPDSIRKPILERLFNPPIAYDDRILLLCLQSNCAGVRLGAVKELRQRKALTVSAAEALILDDAADIRYEGLLVLIQNGRTLPEDEQKRILVKPKPGRGLFSLTPRYTKDTEGEALWNQLKQHQLSCLSDSDLEVAASSSTVFDRDAEFELEARDLAKGGNKIRFDVKDRYASVFQAYVDGLEKMFGPDSTVSKQAKNLKDSMQNELTRKGQDIICFNKDPKDITIIRNSINNTDFIYSKLDVEYISKFGEWSDIIGIVNTLSQKNYSSMTLLGSGFDRDRYKAIASAVSKLSRNRFSELLQMELPNELLPYIISGVSNTSFSNLHDAEIIQLFCSDNTNVRKSAALKCIVSLSKRRLASMLDEYLNGDKTRYYNVVYWLDFGLNVSASRARNGARDIIKLEFN